MMKATSYDVDFNFFTKQDGTVSFMDIQTGFKTYAEAERWSHMNTIDGKVVGICEVD